MTKGKSWPVDDEKNLRDWYSSGITDIGVLAFSFEGRYTEEAIRQKLLKYGLIKEQQQDSDSTQSDLLEELPSIEETLRILTDALTELKTRGLDRAEVLRLRSIITGVKVYQEPFAQYVGYREMEEELMEARRKYAELLKRYHEMELNLEEAKKKYVEILKKFEKNAQA